MAFNASLLPDGVDVVSGSVFPDGWVSPRLRLSRSADGAGRILRISLWNPDLSVRFLNNSLEVVSGEDRSKAWKIKLGQIVDIDLDMSEAQDRPISLSITRFLEPTEYDQRERGMKLVSAEWV